MAAIYHQVRMNASIAKLYAAISTANGIASWWDKPTETHDGVATVLEFNPGAEHGALRMKVLDLLSDKRVEWECISVHPSSSPASAWTGTHLIFEISESTPMAFEVTQNELITVLDFRHTRWDETSKYFGFCNFAWGAALLNLKNLCEAQ